LVAAVTVVTDLPQASSLASQASADASLVRSVNADVASCAYAVGEGFTIWRDDRAGRLTAADRRLTPTLLDQDQEACSFTSETVFDLSTLEAPGSSSGRYMQDMIATVTTWATSDAVAAIAAIHGLYDNPSSRHFSEQLRRAEKDLASDRREAEAEVGAASRLVRSDLPLPKLPRLAG
jgi:hypothetical protein